MRQAIMSSESIPKPHNITIRMIAAELGVTREKARRWCQDGWIRNAINIGGGNKRYWRVTRQALDAFKLSRTHVSAETPQRQSRILRRRRLSPMIDRMNT
jgi:DNA-binding transcriptional regulator LsrR (DeoR family)